MLSWQNTIALFIIFTATLRTLNQAMYCRCSKDEPFFLFVYIYKFWIPINFADLPILKSEYPFCNSVFLITSCY